MKNIKYYNLYIFIQTFTRNIIDIYSVIYLYKQGLNIKNIIAIYALVYFLGCFITYLSMNIGNKIGYKYFLILSSIITSISFNIIHQSNNIYLIALFLSLSIFTYHPIRHYYGINLLKQKKKIGLTLILTYIASLFSSYLATIKINNVFLILLSIISIIPALFIKKESFKSNKYPSKIDRDKFNFFLFDQFRIIFILLEPLYLYIISNNISYVGIFNIILTISSIICIYLLVNKININNNYKYLNIIFVIVLLLKLNIYNKNILLLIAFLEGIGIKTNELVSTINFYHNKDNNIGYIITCEQIFCLIRCLILSIIYFISLNLKIIMYLLLVGLFILSFMYKEKNTSK